MIQKVTDVPFLLSSGVQRIESLQTHQNFEVYKAALAIIDKFFSEEVTLKSSDLDFLKTVRFHFYCKCYIVFHLSMILLYSVQWRPFVNCRLSYYTFTHMQLQALLPSFQIEKIQCTII